MPKLGDGLFGLKADLSCVETASVCTHTLLRMRPKSPSPNFGIYVRGSPRDLKLQRLVQSGESILAVKLDLDRVQGSAADALLALHAGRAWSCFSGMTSMSGHIPAAALPGCAGSTQAQSR